MQNKRKKFQLTQFCTSNLLNDILKLGSFLDFRIFKIFVYVKSPFFLENFKKIIQ